MNRMQLLAIAIDVNKDLMSTSTVLCTLASFYLTPPRDTTGATVESVGLQSSYIIA